MILIDDDYIFLTFKDDYGIYCVDNSLVAQEDDLGELLAQRISDWRGDVPASVDLAFFTTWPGQLIVTLYVGCV